MKRLIVTAAVASALGLAGCSGDSQSDYLAEEGGGDLAPVAASRIQFDPANGVVPLPNDLLFNGTLDGTLEIPGEESGDYTDPQIALGGLDGWSTVAPIAINVDVAEGAAEVDPNSAMAPGAVRLFEVTLGGSLSPDSSCVDDQLLGICKVHAELQYGTDFVVSATGTSLAIVPLKPLKATTGYAYITTKQLLDTDGEPILGSASFDSLRLDLKGFTPDQLFLKGLLDDYIAELSSAYGVDEDSVTYAGAFTTQSVPDAISTVSQLMADGLSPSPQFPISPLFAPTWKSTPAPTGLTVAMALGLAPGTDLRADATDIYTATLSLPYFLPNPTLQEFLAYQGDAADFPQVNSRWMALGDSPLAVLQSLQPDADGNIALSLANYEAQATAQGIDADGAIADPSLLVGGNFLLDNGQPADPNRHISRFNPIPNPCGGADLQSCMMGGQQRVDIPVQITVPNSATFAGFGMTIDKPMTGWPVAMTLHGLGGTKNTTLPLAGAYASQGIATISIDMPLHGDRGLVTLPDGSFAYSATDPSFGDAYVNGNPLVFVNVNSGLTNRDNFRQAIVDHLGVRLALTALTLGEVGGGLAPTFDMTKVSLQGLSLGGIVGTSTTAFANSWPAVLGDNPYALTNASLVAPSGGLAGSFVGSAAFGPVLVQTLVAELAPQCLDGTTGAIIDSPQCAAVVAQIEADVIPPFALSAQTAVDAIDPLNYGAMLAASGTPVHLIEVVGNEVQPGDLVLPNRVDGFPLSGTEPLISALGLAGVIETQTAEAGVSGAVRFSKGHHSSVASPSVPAALTGLLTPEDALAATVEMQTQVVGHAASQGQMLPVTNGCVIQGADCQQ